MTKSIVHYDATRTVILSTPAGLLVEIEEGNFPEGLAQADDETVARQYAVKTGLMVTVRTVFQTTAHRVEEVET
jgi:hypothetical protein